MLPAFSSTEPASESTELGFFYTSDSSSFRRTHALVEIVARRGRAH